MNSSQPPPTRLKWRNSRLVKASMLTIVSYAAFVAFLGLALPFFAQAHLPQWLSQQLGREVQIDVIKLDPFELSVDIAAIKIKEADGNGDFFSLQSLSADLAFWDSLKQGGLRLTSLDIAQPSVSVARYANEEFNIDDILHRLQGLTAKDATKPKEDTPAKPLGFAVETLTLTQGHFTLDDMSSGLKLNYDDIGIHLNDVNSQGLLAKATSPQEQTNRYAIQLKGDANSEFKANGAFQFFPFKLQGKLNADALPLAQYWHAVDKLFKVKLKQGQLTVKGHYALSLNKGSKDTLTWRINQGELSINQLQIDDKQQEKTILSLNTLLLENIQASSKNRTFSMDNLQSHSGVLALVHSKDGIDLVDLFSPVNAETKENTASAATGTKTNKTETQDVALHTDKAHLPEKAWAVSLKNTQIKQYQVNLTEISASETPTLWQFSDINLTNSALDTSLSLPLDYQVSMIINDGSIFESRGQIKLDEPSLDSQINLSNLKLARLQTYVAPFIDLTIEDGTLGAQGQLNINAEAVVKFQGEAQVSSLAIRDNLVNQPLINWQTMDVTGIDFNSADNHISIADVAFDSLFARLIITEDKRTNISELLISQPANAQSAAPNKPVNDTGPAAGKMSKENVLATLDKIESSIEANGQKSGHPAHKPLSFEVKRIIFDKSSAFFADNSLNPNFSSGIEELKGEITDLSSKVNSRASVRLDGKIDKYAPMVLKGKVNPFADKPFLDVDLSFKRVELTSVNPYSGTYAGYYVDKGKLSLDLNYQLKDGQLQGKNHLVIEQLKLGKPSNSKLATSLPITLAIALLQDRHGVIDLGLEVSGDINSPSFSFSNIVFTAMGNLITKVVTSPFTLLANLFGSSDDELDMIGFDYGGFDLQKNPRRSLRLLAKALNDRPLLTIELRGSIDQANDRQALAEAQLHRHLARISGLTLAELPNNLSASQFPATGPLLDALMLYLETELKLAPETVKQSLLTERPELNDEQTRTHWHIALYNLAKQQQKIDNQALSQLALARSQAVKAYLVEKGKVDPERIFLLDSKMTIKQQHSAQVRVNLDASKA